MKMTDWIEELERASHKWGTGTIPKAGEIVSSIWSLKQGDLAYEVVERHIAVAFYVEDEDWRQVIRCLYDIRPDEVDLVPPPLKQELTRVIVYWYIPHLTVEEIEKMLLKYGHNPYYVRFGDVPVADMARFLAQLPLDSVWVKNSHEATFCFARQLTTAEATAMMKVLNPESIDTFLSGLTMQLKWK